MFIFHAVLVDEGREDPNTIKAGRHRPASETSSREHKCENSLNFRGIAMGLYRGWRGGGGGAMSSLDPRMHKDCAFAGIIFGGDSERFAHFLPKISLKLALWEKNLTEKCN